MHNIKVKVINFRISRKELAKYGEIVEICYFNVRPLHLDISLCIVQRRTFIYKCENGGSYITYTVYLNNPSPRRIKRASVVLFAQNNIQLQLMR